MKTNAKSKVTAHNQNANDSSAKVEVIKLGVDLHATKAVVTTQLDGCPAQPPQRIATEDIRYSVYIGSPESKETISGFAD